MISIGETFFLAVGAPDTPDLEAFLDRSLDDVKKRIQAFLNGHPQVGDQTTAIVVMDIEDPHPRDFHLHPMSIQDRLIDAFATRAAAAREKLPQAKLGFYGTLIPDARGRVDDETYVARKRALVRAGCRGMFDQVDCLMPVAYPRFGPTDRAWNPIEAYTRLAVTGSRDLVKSDGSALPVIPLLTYSVANGNSNHHQKLLLDLQTSNPLDATLGLQLNALVDEAVSTAIFWVGEDSDLITRLDNPNGRTVTQHICG